MNIKKIKEPWPHYEIDDYLTNEEFTNVYDYCTSKSFSSLKPSGRYNTFIERDHPTYNILKNRCFEFFDLIDYDASNLDVLCELSVCFSNFVYKKIHTDARWKVSTTVVYVSKTGTGTEMYSAQDKDSLAKTTEWNQNSAFSFFRSDNSWHNYHSVGCTEPRITINVITVPKQIINIVYESNNESRKEKLKSLGY